MLMKREDSLLLIIDVQERLAPVMDSPREVINGCRRLIGVAQEIEIPFLITEQYPKGLGSTMVDLRQIAGQEQNYYTKTEFSCARNTQIMSQIKNTGKKQIILAGVETHICILQTALDLQQMGYDVFVVSDACSSRQPLQGIVALQRLLHNQIEVVTTEMVIFEWLEKSDNPKFKEISKKYVI